MARVSERRTDVDVVRFLALVAMYVAHVAPVPGPAHVLELSEYLTMPLFALLVGVGAQLGSRRPGPATGRPRLVRALALVVLGLALELAEAQVVIVLVHLGVLVLVAALLARLPDLLVADGGAGRPARRALARPAHARRPGRGTRDWPRDAGPVRRGRGPYRLLPMVAVRLPRHPRRAPRRRRPGSAVHGGARQSSAPGCWSSRRRCSRRSSEASSTSSPTRGRSRRPCSTPSSRRACTLVGLAARPRARPRPGAPPRHRAGSGRRDDAHPLRAPDPLAGVRRPGAAPGRRRRLVDQPRRPRRRVARRDRGLARRRTP